MAKHLEVPVTLLTLSTINENLHYGPFACYWWSSRSTNDISVVLGNSEHPRQPGYFCSSGSFSGKIETAPTRAISSLYNEIFHNSTKFSGPTIIGQDDPKIIEEISRDKQVLFVSRIVDNKCIIEIYQQAQKIKIIHGSTPSEVWRKSWFMEKYDGSELYGLKDQKTQN
ncbi:unnamed protein product [Rhizophagus irregularis]|nr:unnamed protein product [Rhizophagus irregularis]CAB4439620.1 unnamed protein product [Rhizophagus irregularis]